MKAKSIAIVTGLASLFMACASTAATTVSAAKPSDTIFLSIANQWTKNILVHEGWIYKKNEMVMPAGNLDWKMHTGEIWDLKVSYFSNGMWVPIAGCPSGSYHSSLKVTVTRSPSDANKPVCTVS